MNVCSHLPAWKQERPDILEDTCRAFLDAIVSKTHIVVMAEDSRDIEEHRGAPPAARGGAGVYIEGELGAFYLLAMMAGSDAYGMPGTRISQVRFQAADEGFSLDDLVVEGAGPHGTSVLEIQSKRTISFAPKDPVFTDVCSQISRSTVTDVAEERHVLAVATQRTSRKISGPYQDVLAWARSALSASAFFSRLTTKGVASPDMRDFVIAFRANLVAAGTEDRDEVIWRLLRRFVILEFDFEAAASLSRTYGVNLARQVLAPEDLDRADALWRVLIETSIGTGKTGGTLEREQLREILSQLGFRLAGERDYGPARARLAETAKLTLDGIGTTVAGVSLPRLKVVAAVDEGLETRRFVELRGGPGVGKSGVLSLLAERTAARSPIIVLDQIATPKGGWLGFAGAYGIPGTAKEFLTDLAASGGATIFVDGLDMISDRERQRTISEILRTANGIEGFQVIATCRDVPPAEAEPWLDDAIIAAFGGSYVVTVGELDGEEIQILIEADPRLKMWLDPDHPAAALASNLYRLSSLQRVPSATTIRTEASLAQRWWKTADGAEPADIREGQRILAALASRALTGKGALELAADSKARSHLLEAKALREVRRDYLDFYHDMLRDWAVGSFIAEDPNRLQGVDLAVHIPPRLARGVEFAGRIVLETGTDGAEWKRLLAALSAPGAHSSWRRQALLALVRSEAGPEILDRCTAELLASRAVLFCELCTAIVAVETVSTAELMREILGSSAPVPGVRHRTNNTGSAVWVLQWVLAKSSLIPLHAIGSVLDLVEIQIQLFRLAPAFGQPTAALLMDWLYQLDIHEAAVTIPIGTAGQTMDSDARGRLVTRLRASALLLSDLAPERLKAYLNALGRNIDQHKLKFVRPLSPVIAHAAPEELARLVIASLIEPTSRGHRRGARDQALSYVDSDYLPASPAQPPFLDLLDAAPLHGLELVRTLVGEAAAFAARQDYDEEDMEPDGFELTLEGGKRFFPVASTYFWSRRQANDYSAASALKALEAWGHGRLDAGEEIEAVIADTLGPEGGCAAYLLVAVDLLLSHWPKSREALVPFLACPQLLAYDFRRQTSDFTGGGRSMFENDEPKGKVTLADLRNRPSRGISLRNVLTAYLGDDQPAQRLRSLLGAAVEELEPYAQHSNWADERFLGRYALNLLDSENWNENEDGNLVYHSPADEAAHLAQLEAKGRAFRDEVELQARIDLALEGGEYATSETARLAVEFANGELPDETDTDALKSRSNRLVTTALLVARDGDDSLLEEYEEWVRGSIELVLSQEPDRLSGRKELRFNRPAIAVLTLFHLWMRWGRVSDRDDLLAQAARRDCCSVPAISNVLTSIHQTDPRFFKAAMRAAFSALFWRWHSYGEDPDVQKRFEEERNTVISVAIAAEIAWLGGGEEPQWPVFPIEKPVLRQGIRLHAISDTEIENREEDDEDEGDVFSLQVDSRAAALWLRLLNESPQLAWANEIADAYSDWTAHANGLGLPREAQIDHPPADWNLQFYVCYARHLFDVPAMRFADDVELVTSLPDKSFGDVAPSLIHGADVLYFDDAGRAPHRAAELRKRLGERVLQMRLWSRFEQTARLSVDYDTAGVAAAMFFGTHDPFNGTRSYLSEKVFDRIDPLLTTIGALLPGGPTAFVALCTMNVLQIAPRARHVGFLLDGVEAWLSRYPTDQGLWIEIGIGHRVIEWLQACSKDDPELLRPAHPMHGRILAVLNQLVSLGVPQAFELEREIAHQEEQAATLSLNRDS